MRNKERKNFTFDLIASFFILVNSLMVMPVPVSSQICEYWVAPPPEGDDSNPGTFILPWARLEYSSDAIPDNNCTVWFKEGEYYGNHRLNRRFNTPTTFKSIHPFQATFLNNGVVLVISGGTNIVLEGFIFTHTGPGAGKLVVAVDGSDKGWSEFITLRNNIFHDSYNNDLLKIHSGVRFVTVDGNVFYNQGYGEQHMDVNSVTDVVIQNNIFFNDFEGSGRTNSNDTKNFLIIKDSNNDEDGLEGSERITVRRNIFLNWQGRPGETLIQVGIDGKPYHEAKDVIIENNLIIGNTQNEVGTVFGVSGAKDVYFVNNSVVGDMPSWAYAFRINIRGLNPQNQNIHFYNNIWSDPTGTMGAGFSGRPNEFSDGDPADTINLVLDNNLYWNGGEEIPPGEVASPLEDDDHRVVADPLLNTIYEDIVLPRWTGSSFLSGNATVSDEFLRLTNFYGRIPPGSPSVGLAVLTYAPADDILGRLRTATPDLGAYEYFMTLSGIAELTTMWLNWSDPNESTATSLSITYTTGTNVSYVTDIPLHFNTYTLTDLLPYSTYTVTLTVRNEENAILAQSNTLTLLTTDKHLYFPFVSHHFAR